MIHCQSPDPKSVPLGVHVVSCVTLWSELAVLAISFAASYSEELLEPELEWPPAEAEAPTPIKPADTDADAFQPD